MSDLSSAIPPRPVADEKGVRLEAVSFGMACAALCVAWVLVALYVVPEYRSYSPDGTLKWIQTKNLRFEHGLRTSVHYGGRIFDPSLRAVPIGQSFFVVKHGEIELVWPPWFALLSWPFEAWLGAHGMRIVPALSAAACAVVTALFTASIAGRRTRLAALLASALATPLFIYAVLIWEHTLCALLVVLGVALWIGSLSDAAAKHSVFAGLLLAFASAMRAETLLVCGALAVVGMFAGERERRVTLQLGVALMLGLVPFGAWNSWHMGVLLPANAAFNFTHPTLDYLSRAGFRILPEFSWGTSDAFACDEPSASVAFAS